MNNTFYLTFKRDHKEVDGYNHSFVTLTVHKRADDMFKLVAKGEFDTDAYITEFVNFLAALVDNETWNRIYTKFVHCIPEERPNVSVNSHIPSMSERFKDTYECVVRSFFERSSI